MSEIVKYTPNMYLRQIPEDGLYLLENVLYKACIMAGMKTRPEGSPERLEQGARILAQSELIKRRYSDFTLDEVQEALEMAYCEGLAGIEQKDIVKNPTKILNKFREIRSFRRNSVTPNYLDTGAQLQEAIERNNEEKNRIRQAFNAAVNAGKNLDATGFNMQELFWYAHIYDMLSGEIEMACSWVERDVYSNEFKKILAGISSGISPEQKKEIISAKEDGEWHEIVKKEAKITLKASLAANAINQQINNKSHGARN